MAFATDFKIPFGRLGDRLCRMSELRADPFAKIAKGSRREVPVLGKASKASRVDHLVKAWTEVAWIELELPGWKLRRLAYKDGEWRCSLSRHPNLPLALDDSVDASHEILPLTILRALAEARLSAGACDATSPVPQIRPAREFSICCDNFI
jgi:hypothetical protein